jgi:hypothetical protein
VWANVKMNIHTPKWTPMLGVGVPVAPESSKSGFKGQNPSSWGIIYIIGKLLKRRCLKLACMTHLDIWNTSYGQKKGRESNWQFDFRPQKMGIDLMSLRAGGVWHVVGKLSAKATTSLQTSSQLEVCTRTIILQSHGSFNFGNFGTPIWESWDKKPFGWRRSGEVQSILYGGRWWLPPSPSRGEFCKFEVVVACPCSNTVLINLLVSFVQVPMSE